MADGLALMRIADDIADLGGPLTHSGAFAVIDRVTSDEDVRRLVAGTLGGDAERAGSWLTYVSSYSREAGAADDVDRLAASCSALGTLVFEQHAEDSAGVIAQLA